MTVNPDGPDFDAFERRFNKLITKLTADDMDRMIVALLDFQMRMNQYVLEVDRNMYDRAKAYAMDYCDPMFHKYHALWRETK